MAPTARRVVQTGEAARTAGPGSLDGDGVTPVLARVMGVWSVRSGETTGGFEVHSILSWWLVLNCNITIYRVMSTVKPPDGLILGS
jgi:hypothetical protein